MRISDWSSDVCSSDLRPSSGRVRAGRGLDLQRRVGSVIETVQDVVGVGPAIVNAAASAVKDHVAPLPFAAPESIFNVPITGARRVAAQSWPIERLRKEIGRAHV